MKSYICEFLIMAMVLATTSMVVADDAKDEAIKKHHNLIEGTWKVVGLEVNGNKADDEDAKKLTVINGSDGTWSLRSEGNEITKGTSIIDPTQKLKTVDFTPTGGDDKGKLFQGIYELSENTRTLCFSPVGEARPNQFTSAPNSGHILVVFERDKDDAIKRDRKRIEGTWMLVALEVNGNKAADEDAKKLKVVIGADGSWSFNSGEKEVAQGTKTIDPLRTPKGIDFTVTLGDDKGKQSFGIYEIGEQTLKFCVAPAGKDRPKDFTSTQSNEHVLLTFEREKSK